MCVTTNKQLREKHFFLLGEFKGIQVHIFEKKKKTVHTNEATLFV